jgi:hypothetical protein
MRGWPVVDRDPPLAEGAAMRFLGSGPLASRDGWPCVVVEVYAGKEWALERVCEPYCVQFADGTMTLAFDSQLVDLSVSWPPTPEGPSCPVGIAAHLMLDGEGNLVWRRDRLGYFSAMMRAAKQSHGGNDPYFHSVWNGQRWVTVPSYSATKPFETRPEAPRALGRSGRAQAPSAALPALGDEEAA